MQVILPFACLTHAQVLAIAVTFIKMGRFYIALPIAETRNGRVNLPLLYALVSLLSYSLKRHLRLYFGRHFVSHLLAGGSCRLRRCVIRRLPVPTHI